jgi:hypothetical protein
VRDFALDRCYFVSIGGDEGGFFVSMQYLEAGDPPARFLVVLNSAWPIEDYQSAAAHEIAHVWLEHPDADLGTDVADHENEAAAKVREWGFEGMGSLPYEERP